MFRASSRVVELETRINKLSEERVELYKTQSENAQRLFRLSEQLRGREENEKRLSEEYVLFFGKRTFSYILYVEQYNYPNKSRDYQPSVKSKLTC